MLKLCVHLHKILLLCLYRKILCKEKNWFGEVSHISFCNHMLLLMFLPVQICCSYRSKVDGSPEKNVSFFGLCKRVHESKLQERRMH